MAGYRSTRRSAGACDACVSHVCQTCVKEKPVEEFYARKRPDGTLFHRKECISCALDGQRTSREADPEKYRAYTRTYYATNAWRARDRLLRKNYGITWVQFQEMHAAQDGRCAICGREMTLTKADGATGACVDHDHATGKVRALLCFPCNTGMGNLQDDPDILMAAAIYLLQHREAVLPCESSL